MLGEDYFGCLSEMLGSRAGGVELQGQRPGLLAECGFYARQLAHLLASEDAAELRDPDLDIALPSRGEAAGRTLHQS